MVLKNLFLRKNELMLVRMMETQNVIKRAVKRSCSAPEAARQSIPRAESFRQFPSSLFTVSLTIK